MTLSWRTVTRALAISVLLFSSVGLAVGQGSKKNSEFDAIEERDRDNARAREQWFMRGRTAPPGESPAALRFRAYQQKLQMRRQQLSARAVMAVPHVNSFGWVPLGPAPLASDPGTGQNYGFVSGRATAVAIDPADPTGNTVYIGGAHGGVWKSTNGLAATPSSVVWNSVLDYESTLAVGSIAIQPSGNTDTTKSVILVGTGEPNSSADSYYGLGILRSTDGGASWALITADASGTHSFAGLGFSKIAFSTSNPQLVVAAAAAATQGVALGLENPGTVNRGIYYSQDAGLTWHYASITDAGTAVSPGSVTSVVYNAGAGKFFAAARYHGIYSSTDGINWTRLADANQPGAGLTTANCPSAAAATCPIYRAELAVVPGRMEMYTWVVSLDSNTGLEVDGGVWQNMNGGTGFWTSIADDGITNCGDNGDGCGVQQGAYNLEIAALPDGSGTDVYAGAINVFKCRITSPTSPSCSWLNLTHVYGCLSIANVHPDQHHLAGIVEGGKQPVYFANDGGVYRALDGYTDLTTGACGTQNQFDDLNGTLGSMTQFVSFSIHPSDANTLLGGTQDNGSPATGSATTSTNWLNVLGGDGGYNVISPTTATDWFTAGPDVPPNSLAINYCGSGINCTGLSFQPVVTSIQVGNDDCAFYFPYILDPQATTQLIVGTCRVWRGGPATSTSGTYIPLSNNFDTGAGGTAGTCNGSEVNQVRSLAAGGPKDSNGSKVIYAGTDSGGGATTPAGGRVFVTTNAGTTLMADVTDNINPNEYPVSAIALDPSDPSGKTAYVTIMGFDVGHVFKTTNAGQSWTDFSGSSPNNIPDAPADTVVVDSQAGMVYVGTDVGVFVSSKSNPSWTEVGPQGGQGVLGYLPNVPVTALRLFNSGGQKLLRASTYGRGIWQYDLAPDYQISISNSVQTIFRTQTATFNGKLTAANGYASAVALSCTSNTTAPPATCAPNPTSVTPTAHGTTFTVNATGSVQDYVFNMHAVGTDASATTHDAGVTLHVVDFSLGAASPASVSVQQGSTSGAVTFLVTGAGSFSGTVTLACPTNGMPAGVTCNFTPSASVSVPAPPVTLTFAATASAPTGTTAITISATTPGAPAPKTQSVSLTVTPPIPDYSLTISNSPQSATVNQMATLSGTLKAVNGYSSAVNLSCGTGAPPTCTISPASLTPTVAGEPFTVTVQSGVAQTYNFNINATGTDAAHVAHIAPVVFNSLFTFTISDSSGTQTIKAGQKATYRLLLTPMGAGAFPSAVTFSCTGLPVGATCSAPTVAAGTNGVQTVALTVSTSGPNHAVIRSSSDLRWSPVPFVVWVSSIGMVIGGFGRKLSSGKKAMSLVAIALAVILTLFLPGCGGGQVGTSGAASVISVSISPLIATPYTTDHQQFTATVSGTTNTQVQWQVNGVSGGSAVAGTVDGNGMYTAPAVVPSASTVSVSAISLADVTKFASAKVTVLPPAVLIDPTTYNLFPGLQQRFTATVHGVSDTQVSWQVNGIIGGNSTVGTIDASGLYTAPRVVPNPAIVTLSAVSTADPTTLGSALVTIQSPIVSISPTTAALYPSQQQQFAAAVSGGLNTQVTWQVNGVTGGSASAGTVDGMGLYTAPAAVPTAASVTVAAISQADVTKSGSATVNILSPTPSGTYTVTIAATAGSVTQTTTATLVVQ